MIFRKYGLFVDLLQTKEPSAAASPPVPYRQAANEENLSVDPKTEKIRGWVLFAIKF